MNAQRRVAITGIGLVTPVGNDASSANTFPANLDQHLAALKSAGFTEVDCFWKDLRQALFGGYA